MEAAAERAFAQLKMQLSALSYTEPVGVESAPLVQRLLNDLVLTSESFEAMRERAEAAEHTASSSKEDAAPFRKENSRLIRENNEVRVLAWR